MSDLTDKAIRVQRHDHIAVITFERAERMNTLAKDLVCDLRDVLQELKSDPSIRVLVLTGAGDRAFCAGADLVERKAMSEAEVRSTVAGLQNLTSDIANFPRPTIAAINGYAFGGGLEIALACDLRYISDNARIGLTETRLGIIPGAGGTQRLPRLIGLGRAREMIFTGRRIDAATAVAWGVAEDVYPQEDLLSRVLDTAKEIAAGGPLALEQAKFAINHGFETDMQTGLALERAAYDTLIPTHDRVEALEAFTAKRSPKFEGR